MIKNIAILFLLLFGIGNVWAWNWETNQTVIWDAGNSYTNWTSAYFTVGNNNSNAGYKSMTRLGSSGQFVYKETGSNWDNYGWAVFFKSQSWNNDQRTTGIGQEVNGKMYVSLNSQYSCYCDDNERWNWQVVSSPVKGTSGKTIYFDDTYSQWGSGNIYFKYGVEWDGSTTEGFNRKIDFSTTKVPGTANLYKLKASSTDASNQGATNASGQLSHDIYYTKWYVSRSYGYTNQNPITDSHVLERTAIYADDISQDYTLIPTAVASGDGSDGNPKLWTTTQKAGHTWTVTISSYSHGTVTVSYTDEDNSSQSKTSGNFDVAHTCLISATAVAAEGYKRTAFTVGGNAYTSGNYTVRANTTVAATFTAKQSAITIDYQDETDGYGSGKDGITNVGLKGTYDAAMTTLTGTMPTAATGYKFAGFYSETNGGGTKYYNANGTSAHIWDKDTEEGTTLYAYYEKAEITNLSFSPATTGTSTSVTITPTISPTPEGTVYICWGLFYDEACTEEIPTTFTPDPSTGSGSVTFTTPSVTGAYYVQATLHTSSSCGSDAISTRVRQYVVSDEHTVTIRHMFGDTEIHAPTSITIEPGNTQTATALSGNEVFGYGFSTWEISGSSGVTKVSGELTDPSITISAVFDGTIIAKYNKKNMIFFKDNLGWGQVHVNLLSNMKWGYQGTGNDNNYYDRNQLMSLVPGTTDIYYYEYSTSTSAYVSFTKQSYPSSTGFYESDTQNPALVVYPTRPNATVDDKNYYDNANYGFLTSTPMFVPLATQTGQNYNGDHARYFSKGYWVNYIGEETGYVLEIYNSDGTTLRQSKAFTSADKLMEMTASMDLEAGQTYKYQLKRGSIACGNAGTMSSGNSGTTIGWGFTPGTEKCGLLTTVAGSYDFRLNFSDNGSGECELRIGVTYPAATGDYRIVYTDNATWTSENGAHTLGSYIHPSRTIAAQNGVKDTISFFVNKDASPRIKIQYISSLTPVTWANEGDFVNIPDTIKAKGTGVYNFIYEQKNNSISLIKIEPYTGSYYIRTDCAGTTKWSDYVSDDHKITYSEYSQNKTTGDKYTHYYMKFVDKSKDGGKYKNVKFCIANDFSPCISDTLTRMTSDESPNHVDASGNLQVNANIRFMWDIRYNSLSRKYMAEGKTDGSKFLVLQGQSDKLLDKDGYALLNSAKKDEPGYNHKAPDNAIQFTDDENWIYEAVVKAVPGGRVKLYARYDDVDHYFYGTNDADFTDNHAIDLITGEGSAELIRVMYDFKSDRLLAAWIPSNTTIDGTTKHISADIMLVRKHQESGVQINLENGGTITQESGKTVYGVLQFNKYTLNNLSPEGEHDPLPPGDQKSSFERHNYFFSFPFNVKLGDIFGFGQVGVHWRILRYDGLGRAQEGFFAERTSNWVMLDDTENILNANEGYMLQLSPSAVRAENTTTWANNLEQIELYFPSTNPITSIVSANCTIPALNDDYKCNINLKQVYLDQGYPEAKAEEADRRIKDSYWRCIGVPGFTSYKVNSSDWVSFGWEIDEEDVPYLYEWVKTDNSLRVISTSSAFTFYPMHAYLIQNKNDIVWTSIAKPVFAAIAAKKTHTSQDQYPEFRIELQQDSEVKDQTYIRLTDQEEITENFDFGYDLSKEMNVGGNIYTLIGSEKVAGNCLPLSQTETTLVPMGVKIATAETYTISIPSGTYGIGVTLIDEQTGDRTSLSAMDYIVELDADNYTNRFFLEIAPIKTMPTDIENVQGDNVQGTKARKIMIDGILYIRKDGKIYDARGVRIQ